MSMAPIRKVTWPSDTTPPGGIWEVTQQEPTVYQENTVTMTVMAFWCCWARKEDRRCHSSDIWRLMNGSIILHEPSSQSSCCSIHRVISSRMPSRVLFVLLALGCCWLLMVMNIVMDMCVCVCVCVYMRVCVSLSLCVCICVHACLSLSLSPSLSISVSLSLSVYVCMFVSLSRSLPLSLCVCVCLHYGCHRKTCDYVTCLDSVL